MPSLVRPHVLFSSFILITFISSTPFSLSRFFPPYISFTVCKHYFAINPTFNNSSSFIIAYMFWLQAFVIYNFFLLCVELCGGEEAPRRHFSTHRQLKHMFPCSCCGTFNMSLLLDTCRFFILQYSLVKPTTAIITLVFYGTSRLHTTAIFWIAVINNISVSIALYYLIAFYQAAKSNASFACAKPLAKFMSVKLIVFFVFWQSLFISTLSAFGWIQSNNTDDREELATGFSDFLICIEMAIMSICHCIIYSASEHQYGFFVLQNVDNPLQTGVKTVELDPASAVIDVLLMQDLLEDVLQMAKSMPRLGQHSMKEVARRAKPPAASIVLVDRYHWNSRQAQRSHRDLGDVPHGSTSAIENSADVVHLRRQIQEARSPEERLDRRAELARVEHSQQLASGYNGLFDSFHPWDSSLGQHPFLLLP